MTLATLPEAPAERAPAERAPAERAPAETGPTERAALDDLPPAILRELRSDHAGELGAVWIYRGILAVSRDAAVRSFAEDHMRSEQTHLDFFLAELPPHWRSRLAPLWRLAGFVLGALPALFGPRAVYATVAAVETFVDDHYQVQIDMLEPHPEYGWLRDVLVRFRDDELHHRDDAAARNHGAPVGGLWARIVIGGSVAGAMLARRL